MPESESRSGRNPAMEPTMNAAPAWVIVNILVNYAAGAITPPERTPPAT